MLVAAGADKQARRRPQPSSDGHHDSIAGVRRSAPLRRWAAAATTAANVLGQETMRSELPGLTSLVRH